ncbi:MAG TPA: J domain-containing protein, partial [Kofleriaceae bacterium]|nr:J domain-containing protein [Kofleriaceae bacterium]
MIPEFPPWSATVPGIPDHIPALGPSAQRPRPDPSWNPAGKAVTREEYYVLSRIDGHTSIRDIVLISGLAADKALAAVHKLFSLGAIALPEAPPATATAVEPSLEPLDAEEAAAMAEDVNLSDAEKRRILAMRRAVHSGDHFVILGLEHTADARALRRAYFRISKQFHPDRFYGRKLGCFGPWLSQIFESANRSY